MAFHYSCIQLRILRFCEFFPYFHKRGQVSLIFSWFLWVNFIDKINTISDSQLLSETIALACWLVDITFVYFFFQSLTYLVCYVWIQPILHNTFLYQLYHCTLWTSSQCNQGTRGDLGNSNPWKAFQNDEYSGMHLGLFFSPRIVEIKSWPRSSFTCLSRCPRELLIWAVFLQSCVFQWELGARYRTAALGHSK